MKWNSAGTLSGSVKRVDVNLFVVQSKLFSSGCWFLFQRNSFWLKREQRMKLKVTLLNVRLLLPHLCLKFEWFFLLNSARRRAERKKIKKLGKSTDTEEEDGELDDEGILVLYYCIPWVTFFYCRCQCFTVDKKKKKGKSDGSGGDITKKYNNSSIISIFAHYVCYEL